MPICLRDRERHENAQRVNCPISKARNMGLTCKPPLLVSYAYALLSAFYNVWHTYVDARRSKRRKKKETGEEGPRVRRYKEYPRDKNKIHLTYLNRHDGRKKRRSR